MVRSVTITKVNGLHRARFGFPKNVPCGGCRPQPGSRSFWGIKTLQSHSGCSQRSAPRGRRGLDSSASPALQVVFEVFAAFMREQRCSSVSSSWLQLHGCLQGFLSLQRSRAGQNFSRLQSGPCKSFSHRRWCESFPRLCMEPAGGGGNLSPLPSPSSGGLTASRQLYGRDALRALPQRSYAAALSPGFDE